MKYFLVTCKHGHVGRDKYIPIDIPITAETVNDAIQIARNKGGVKRDHPDWCLAKPVEIDKEAYLKAKEQYINDPYFNNKTRQNLEFFKDRLVKEPNYTYQDKLKTNTKIYTKKRSKEFNQIKARTIQKINKIKFNFDEDEAEE